MKKTSKIQIKTESVLVIFPFASGYNMALHSTFYLNFCYLLIVDLFNCDFLKILN